MTINISTVINIQQKIPFTSVNLVTGLSSFAYTLLKDGAIFVATPTPTFTEIGSGLYTFNFTPAATGLFTIFVQSDIVATLNVTTKDMSVSLANLEDQALGSWTWDKVAGTLTMIRQNGSVLATFLVNDTLTTASRARQ